MKYNFLSIGTATNIVSKTLVLSAGVNTRYVRVGYSFENGLAKYSYPLKTHEFFMHFMWAKRKDCKNLQPLLNPMYRS
jgi:hypothetical protein